MAPKIPIQAPIHLEGTTLEGGGQLLRLALGLSSLTKKPINITNIRGKRSGGGGLKSQHLTCVQWLGQACNARLSGVGLKSKEITFTPSTSKGRNVELDAGDVRINQSTPGAVNLVFQAILPYMLFSGGRETIRVRITGGTNVSNSPSVDYIAQVLIPMLELIGIPCITPDLHSRGWSQGPVRLGSITYTITPLTKGLPAFQLTNRGDVCGIRATIIAPQKTERHFRDELAEMFARRESRFFSHANATPDIDITFEDSCYEKRYYLLLVATTTTGKKLGRDWLYDQSIRPGKLDKVIPTLVKRVSDNLLAELEHGGCVDEYLRDQLVVFQALAEGRSVVYGGKKGEGLVEPSLHAKTAVWVAKELVGVEFDDEGGCEGIGLYPGRDVDSVEETLHEDLEKLHIVES